jgi:hypothetical protein
MQSWPQAGVDKLLGLEPCRVAPVQGQCWGAPGLVPGPASLNPGLPALLHARVWCLKVELSS